MRTLLKIIAVVVILAIAGLIALPFVVDPNDYKQQISEQVEKATGRTLSLDGDIGLSVFPWVALELGPLTLSNAKGFDAEHFAKIDAAQVRIKLMPLLQKKLEMDTIVLDGLVLNLEKDKAGSANWDDLGQSADQKAEDDTSDATADESSGARLAALSIAGVELTNANVIWSDKSAGAYYNIQNFNLNTDPLEPSKPTAVEMDFDLSSTEPQMTAHIALESQLAIDLDKQLYTLSNLSFKTQAEGDALPLSKIDLAISGDVNADLAKQTVDFSALLIQIQDLAIESTINVSQVLDTPSFTGNISIKPFNLRQLAKQLAIELPTMADDSTLELVQLSSQLEGSDSHINLNDLQLKLDQSTLTGQLAVKNFDKPAISFKLALNEIDADRYMPPVTEDAETNSAPTATAGAAAASQLPLETLRALNLNGSLDIGQLKMSGTHSDNIHINIAANKGVIKLKPMSANLYQGQYKGNVNLDARGNNLKLSLDESVSNVQAGPLLKDLSGDDKISGVVSGKVKLSGQGKTSDQIKETLSGNGNFSFTDGALKGLNIADSIRKAKAVLKGENPTAAAEAPTTDFSSLTGSFSAKNGVINNQDLALMSPLLRVKGAGTADLAKELIDYTLGVSIVETSKGQQGKELADLKGLTIPVKISGTFNDPKPTVDLATLFKDNAEAKVKEKLDAEKARLKDKVSEKLNDKLGSELGGLLGGVLGNKKADPEAEPSAEETPPAKSLEDELKGKLKGFF
jgi:AsmA protein